MTDQQNQPTTEVLTLPDTAALADTVAQRFAALAAESIAARGRFVVALSGGSTPRALHQRLSQPPLRDTIDWSRVEIFWGDERFVPPDDPESSYRMARETLLNTVPVPPQNVHPVPTTGLTPEQAAGRYAAEIAAALGEELPRFDLILLGMGPDGHTASIFPGHPEARSPGDAAVIAVHGSPKPPPIRISFSYRLINNARAVYFLVAGADKAEALRAVLNDPPDPARLPAQGIRPTNGWLVWCVDAAAAARLAGL